MLKEKLRDINVILASGSPRRKFFLEELKLDFEIILKEIDEAYPAELKGKEISDYLAIQKSQAFSGELHENDLLITADTIVWAGGKAYGKPGDAAHAREMLRELSGKEHEVITSVALTNSSKQVVFNESTKVRFKELSDLEIDFYIENYRPFDKAGSYGIQEWIGYIGIQGIEGSYFNVVGFPVQKFYQEVLKW